jgi:mono/diheme cytochrome c family protein
MNRSSKIVLTLIASLGLSRAASADEAKKIDFVKDVQPIFKASCVKCHGADPDKPKKKAAAKLWLDDKTAAMKGGKSGVAIVPGDSKNSLLFKLLSGPVPKVDPDDDDKDIPPMPKAKRGEKWKALPDDQIATIKLWIDQGAQWPAAKPVSQ